jgi:hypothetical protein
MLKIADCPLSRYQNDEHYNFHTDVNGLITYFTAASLLIVAEYATYSPLLEDEGVALNIVRKSSYSQALSESDKVRDNTIFGMDEAISSGLRHFNAEIREAAKRLKILRDSSGNIARKAYSKESGDVIKLLADLRGPHATDVTAARIGEWVDELEVDQNNFVATQNHRYDEAGEKTRLRMKEVRIEVDEAYRTLVNKINALIIVNGEAPYVDFVNKLNLRIEAYTNNLAIYKGRSKTTVPAEEVK